MTYNDEELIQITESLKQEWLDKACEWLIDNSHLYINSIGGMVYYNVVSLIRDFKKAMEKNYGTNRQIRCSSGDREKNL